MLSLKVKVNNERKIINVYKKSEKKQFVNVPHGLFEVISQHSCKISK